MKAKRRTISYRRRAAIVLAQMYRIANVMRDAGEILAPAPWLRVLANILSSAPPRYDGDRKAAAAPDFFGLTVASLACAAKRCGLTVTAEEIERNVRETCAWRAKESKRIGRPHHAPMQPDKIGALLGVTDSIRLEAQAWNIGTFDGNPAARRDARREKARLRDTISRRAKGAVPRDEYIANSISKRKPWEAERMSRTAWYERRRETEHQGIRTSPCATNKSGQVPAGQVPARPISGSRTSPCATNINKPTSGRFISSANLQKADQVAPILPGQQETRRDGWIVRRGPKGLIVADLILPLLQMGERA